MVVVRWPQKQPPKYTAQLGAWNSKFDPAQASPAFLHLGHKHQLTSSQTKGILARRLTTTACTKLSPDIDKLLNPGISIF